MCDGEFKTGAANERHLLTDQYPTSSEDTSYTKSSFYFPSHFPTYQIEHRYNNHILTSSRIFFIHACMCLLIIKCTYVLWCKDQLYTTAAGSRGSIGQWLKTFCDVNGMKLRNVDNSYCIVDNILFVRIWSCFWVLLFYAGTEFLFFVSHPCLRILLT